MTIQLTREGVPLEDVEILTKRAVGNPPALLVDNGKLYTMEDGGGTTQLWYMDDAGTPYQITPTSVFVDTLQTAYNNGQSIVTGTAAAPDGPIAFTRGSTIAVGISLLALSDGDLSTARTAALMAISDANVVPAGPGTAALDVRRTTADGTAIRAYCTGTGDLAFVAGNTSPADTAAIFGDGDTVLGGSAMAGTEKLRVVGRGLVEGGVIAGASEGLLTTGSFGAVDGAAIVRGTMARTAALGAGTAVAGFSTAAIGDAGDDATSAVIAYRASAPTDGGGAQIALAVFGGAGANVYESAVKTIDQACDISAVRTTDGPGYDASLKASNGRASAGASTGGQATLQSGNAQATVGSTAGQRVTVRAGNAAGAVLDPAVQGGSVYIEVGNGAGVGFGTFGDVIFQNAAVASGTPNLLPRVDGEGKIGTRFAPDPVRRWAEVNAAIITAGAIYEEETFDEESLDLEGKLAALSRELDEPSHPTGLRHLARIAMVTARTVLDLGRKAA